MQEVPPSDKIRNTHLSFLRILALLASSQRLTRFNPLINIYMKSKNPNTPKGRTRHIDIRLTEEEYEMVVKKATECGMTLSSYGRKLFQGHRPSRRLTHDEMQALNSLSDARADLIRIQNTLKGKPDTVKKQYFRDATFMRLWIASVDKLIVRWGQIRDSINQN